MNYFSKPIVLFISFFLISCFKQNNDTKKIEVKKDTTTINNTKIIESLPPQIVNDEKKYEENGNDEFISNSLFGKWKGKYVLKKEDLTDSWGRESTSFSELNLIQPDSCIFRSWLADSKGKRYIKDDNYQEFIGVILATSSKDSIEFYTKKVVAGGNNSLSPLLTLTQKDKSYSIYSLITSPPHNGIIEIPIEKQ